MRNPIHRVDDGNLEHYIKFLEQNENVENPFAEVFLGQKSPSALENTFIQAGNYINLSELDKQQP